MKPFNYIYFLINNLYVFYLCYSNSGTLYLCVPNSYFIFSRVFPFLCFAISLLPFSYFFFLFLCFSFVVVLCASRCVGSLRQVAKANTQRRNRTPRIGCFLLGWPIWSKVPRAMMHVSFNWRKWCNCNCDTSSECIPFPPENANNYWLSGALPDVC